MKISFKYILSFLCLFILGNAAFAQYKRFPVQGVVEYEMRINMHALIKKSMAENPNDVLMEGFFEEYKKKNPQFKTKNTQLYFNKNRSLYTQQEEAKSNELFGITGLELLQVNNIIESQLDAGTMINQKRVYDETFLVKDSLQKITWKITDETRNIAGYECRRANALVQDSIYIVAFYTDVIPVSSGPESFNGLPGMILGVAMPHHNISWFATAVREELVPAEKLIAPTKGRITDRNNLQKTLKEIFKGWGSYMNERLKFYLL